MTAGNEVATVAFAHPPKDEPAPESYTIELRDEDTGKVVPKVVDVSELKSTPKGLEYTFHNLPNDKTFRARVKPNDGKPERPFSKWSNKATTGIGELTYKLFSPKL